MKFVSETMNEVVIYYLIISKYINISLFKCNTYLFI